jgi:hypothetical protein
VLGRTCGGDLHILEEEKFEGNAVSLFETPKAQSIKEDLSISSVENMWREILHSRGASVEGKNNSQRVES